jgi:hypothetical protein
MWYVGEDIVVLFGCCERSGEFGKKLMCLKVLEVRCSGQTKVRDNLVLYRQERRILGRPGEYRS